MCAQSCGGSSCGSAGSAAASMMDSGAADMQAMQAQKRLDDSLNKIKNRIVVMSGKGGVGKTTVAVNLAVGLALAGKRVGLLDVDVHGPSVPRMLQLEKIKAQVSDDSIIPVEWPVGSNGGSLKVMSLGFFLPNGTQAVIWRGPVKIGFINQLVGECAWGDLDYLVVDCPPGTGDEPLTAVQVLTSTPDANARALVVTTPQAVAIDDVRRSLGFCGELKIPVLGLVENMSGIVCSSCGNIEPLFGQGGGQALAKEMSVPFLAALPLDPQVAQSGDDGNVYIKNFPDRPTAQAFQAVLDAALKL
ncbi:MAG: Mrp/NBP35 family ATP-binding protein [Pseudomonadota bacterium]